MSDTTTDLPEIHHEHRDLATGWLRPTVFGMMDGLVSNFALIAGVAGASATSKDVSLAGLAGLVGGAFSMATGEYVSVQSQNESARVAEQLSRDPDQALLIHAQEELGVDPHQLPSPWTAAYSSLASFSVGALLPLLPYLLGASRVWYSAILAVLALFFAGAVASRWTSRSLLYSGARQLVLGVLAAAVTYGVGSLFHAAVGCPFSLPWPRCGGRVGESRR